MGKSMMTKTYLELIELQTFQERLDYLRIGGVVGEQTFGYDRYLNQNLYHSYEWKSIRRKIIIRDNGCDLGCAGYDIRSNILIHHINPITIDDILNRDPKVFDQNNLICTSHGTHNAIHYGTDICEITYTERKPYDTCPWRHD